MSNQPPYGPPYQGQPQPPHQGQPPQYGPPNGPPQYGPPSGPPQYGPQYGQQPQYAAPQQQPQYGQQAQFGWGSGGFPPPPPRKKSKAPWLLGGIFVLFAAVIGLWLTGVVIKNNKHDNYVSQPTYTPTYQPSYDPTSPAATEQPTSAPTAPTTAPKPTAPAPTKTTPPPPPRPSDTDIVAKNAFYKSGVQRTVNCKEPAARANSGANARKYYLGVLACLNKAWPRHLALAKQNFRAPNLVSFTGAIQTPCSGGAPSSFYCSANQTIYMDAKGDIDDFKKYSTFNNRSEALAYLRAGMVDTVAHEYGHHLQNLTGILIASDNLQYERSGDAALQMSRKLEIQATCLGNVFMGANKGSYKFNGLLMSQLNYLHSHQGDEYGTRRDHGSRTIMPRWSNAGFNSRNPNACNTYVAPAALVR